MSVCSPSIPSFFNPHGFNGTTRGDPSGMLNVYGKQVIILTDNFVLLEIARAVSVDHRKNFEKVVSPHLLTANE